MSTGGGFATRELYSDSEETLFDAMRPVVVTAIDDIATRSDLLDRALIVNLQRIEKGQRKTEEQLHRELGAVLPGVLGTLLSAVSTGLRELPHTTVEDAPRMADFATWATACEQGLGLEAGSIIEAYRNNRAGVNDLVLEVSPVASALQEMMEARATEGVSTWEGTSSDLLTVLEERVDDRTRKARAWPNSARGLSAILRRIAPNLRELGLSIAFNRGTGRDRKRLVRLTFRKGTGATVRDRPTVHVPSATTNSFEGSVDAKTGEGATVSSSSDKEECQGRLSDDMNAADADEQARSNWVGMEL